MISLKEIDRGRYGYSYGRTALDNYSWREYIVFYNDNVWGGIAAHRNTQLNTFELFCFPIDVTEMVLICNEVSVKPFVSLEDMTWQEVEKYIVNWANKQGE